jgi:hypothetical protein
MSEDSPKWSKLSEAPNPTPDPTPVPNKPNFFQGKSMYVAIAAAIVLVIVGPSSGLLNASQVEALMTAIVIAIVGWLKASTDANHQDLSQKLVKQTNDINRVSVQTTKDVINELK